MPSYTSQTSDFASIARVIKSHLATCLSLDPAYVRIAASDNYKLQLMEDKAVVLRYYGPNPFPDAGAGRYAQPVTRLIRVYTYVRSNTDYVGDDTEALTDAELGLSGFEESVYDALAQYTPISGTTVLTIEPLHPVDSSSGPPERKPEDDVGVVRSSLLFECRYLLKIDQSHVPT